MYDFEDEREAAIARNKAIIEALGLNVNEVVVSRKKSQPKGKPPKKRKEVDSDEEENGEPVKRPRKSVADVTTMDGDATGGPRRSGRNAGKNVDYKGDGEKLQRNDGPRVLSEQAGKAGEVTEARTPMERKHDP